MTEDTPWTMRYENEDDRNRMPKPRPLPGETEAEFNVRWEAWRTANELENHELGRVASVRAEQDRQTYTERG